MIYLISFVEAVATGITSINLALYLKFILKLSEIDTAKLISSFGVITSILIFLCGHLIDKYGIRNCAVVGASLLAIGRLILGSTSSIYFTILCLTLMALGTAVKSGAIVVFLKRYNKSFKIDYVVFNSAYCLAGIGFDLIKNYSLVYTISGFLTIINVLLLLFLPKDDIKPPSSIKKTLINYSVLKRVLLYTSIMTPVTCIFAFMSNFIPKSALHILGPDAPIGKLYGSLNPFIILLIVPLYAMINNRLKLNPFYTAVFGTFLSAASLFLIGLPGGYLSLVIPIIIVFTIGEAIWSPANMELAAKICPTGEEGKYMTLSLIPRTLGSVIMSYFISFSFTTFIYTEVVDFKTPFLIMGAFSILTPILLFKFFARARNELEN